MADSHAELNPLNADLASMDEAQLRDELVRVRLEIRRHMMEEGHDRCWVSDKNLYERTLPEGSHARFSLPKFEEWVNGCHPYCMEYFHNRQPFPNVAKEGS